MTYKFLIGALVFIVGGFVLIALVPSRAFTAQQSIRLELVGTAPSTDFYSRQLHVYRLTDGPHVCYTSVSVDGTSITCVK